MSDQAAAYEWQPGDPCPCGCAVASLKISYKTQHVRGCACRSCQGRRNRKKGRAAQTQMHHSLGGEGISPTHEESSRGYTVQAFCMPESKAGEQIPASFAKFIGTDWFRRALEQSERGMPAGSSAKPAVYLEPSGSSVGWLVIRIGRT